GDFLELAVGGVIVDRLPLLARARAREQAWRIAIRGRRQLVELSAGHRPEAMKVGLQVRMKRAGKVKGEKPFEGRVGCIQVDSTAVGHRVRRADGLRAHHSALAPEARTTLPQRATSALTTA